MAYREEKTIEWDDGGKIGNKINNSKCDELANAQAMRTEKDK